MGIKLDVSKNDNPKNPLGAKTPKKRYKQSKVEAKILKPRIIEAKNMRDAVWGYGDQLDDVVIIALGNGSWSVRATSKNGNGRGGEYVVETVFGDFRCVCPASCWSPSPCAHVLHLRKSGIKLGKDTKPEYKIRAKVKRKSASTDRSANSKNGDGSRG